MPNAPLGSSRVAVPVWWRPPLPCLCDMLEAERGLKVNRNLAELHSIIVVVVDRVLIESRQTLVLVVQVVIFVVVVVA